MANANGAIGWDDEVSTSDAGEMSQPKDDFIVLPAGTYKATINKIERGSFNGSEKMDACPMVTISAIIDGGDLGRSYTKTRFFMHTKTLWRIFEFMEALGLRKKGDSTAMRIPWNKVEKGMTCRAEVKIHSYKDKEYNEVDKWYLDDAADSDAAKSEPNVDDMPDF